MKNCWIPSCGTMCLGHGCEQVDVWMIFYFTHVSEQGRTRGRQDPQRRDWMWPFKRLVCHSAACLMFINMGTSTNWACSFVSLSGWTCKMQASLFIYRRLPLDRNQACSEEFRMACLWTHEGPSGLLVLKQCKVSRGSRELPGIPWAPKEKVGILLLTNLF